MAHITVLLQSVIYTLVVVVFWFIAKLIVDKMTVYNDDYEIETKKNFSMGLMRSGLYLGIAIGMAGALSDNGIEHKFWKDVSMLFIDGILIVPLFIIARLINDKLILAQANNDDEIGRGNIAVGVAEFGSLLGTGFILNGSFSGEGSVLSSIVFFILGQVSFIVFHLITEKIGGYNTRKHVKEGNVAAGIFLAAKFIALGLILRASIAGPSLGWSDDIASFSISAVAGVIILLFFNRIADWIFLPNSEDKEQIEVTKNSAAMILAAGIEVGLAAVVSVLI